MNLILLSGGSGKRLWPLSNDVRSKQFLKLFKNEAGEYESMAQRVVRQLREVCPEAAVTITTGESQKSAILNQLAGPDGTGVSVCCEPSRRDTFPAIALAAAYLASEKGLDEEEPVIVCPIDPFVGPDYFAALLRLEAAVRVDAARLVLMGVAPTYPSAKYGYLMPGTAETETTVPGTDGGSPCSASAAPGTKSTRVRSVLWFKEKPTEEKAAEYIAEGALWNCGVFGFKLGYLLGILERYLPTRQYKEVYENYDKLPKISFDYEVTERERSVGCIRFDGSWKDVGTWNTLAEEMSEPTLGNVVLGGGCENVHAVNELEQPLLVMGAKDMIVAAGPDGILVSDKHQSSYIKPHVDALHQRVMFKEEAWGQFRVLHEAPHSMTIHLSVWAGRQMSYHRHQKRDEVWTVLSGEGEAVLENETVPLCPGTVLRLPAGARHTLKALTDMELVEVQLGRSIEDADIEQF